MSDLRSSDSASAAVTRLDRWVARRVLEARGAPPISLVLWDGEEIRVSPQPPAVRIAIRDRRTARELLTGTDLDFGDAYTDGRLALEGDLVRFLEEVNGSEDGIPTWAWALRRLLRPRTRGSSRRAARRNIHHHYDVGNDFYRIWLDPQMQYTCAYFPTPQSSLERAQLAKMDHVCRKLDLRPGERVVEAGCGWGTFALHMAERYGVRVVACNISEEQIDYARAELERRGLGQRVEFRLEDYRDLRGRYDAFVSVGMLEHVGLRHYGELGRVIDRCLEPHGRGLLHFIGRARPRRLNPYLAQRIFPGAHAPSLREMLRVLEPHDLATWDVENLRHHYALTLQHWLERFEKSAEVVRDLYDDAFVRSWRLYLAGTMMSFRQGWAQLYQVLFARSGARMPWTREGLYPRPDDPGRGGDGWSAATS